MEGVEQLSSLMNKKALPQAKVDATLGATPHAPAVGPIGVEPTTLASLRGEKEKMEEVQKNTVMCTNLVARSRDESEMEWVPPTVTHEFSYPSDEEIMPNPKANFKRSLLPRLGHVRSWFKGTGETQASGDASMQVQARTSAPCLPITAGIGSLFDGDRALASDTSPRCYVSIETRIAQHPEDL
jgi:hypothetical protein